MRATLLLSLIGLTTPLAAFAEDNRHFLFTGDGIAEGEGRVALGLNALMIGGGGLDTWGGLPSIDIRYGRGISGPIDLRLSLDSLGVYNAFDAGAGIALIRAPNFGFGLRAGITGIIVATGDGGGGVFAATPGAVATLRGDNVALSFGADVPMFFNGFIVSPSQSNTGAGFVPSVRPNITLEAGSAAGAKFYLRGEATMFFVEGIDMPILANIAAGVHF